MKTIITADWAPHIEAAARAIAAAAAFCYVTGYISGRWLHNLNSSLTALLVRRPQPAPASTKTAWAKPVIRRLALAEAPANVAPPRDPMARAVAKVHGGMSQRAAATLCGVSRSSLQRALRA